MLKGKKALITGSTSGIGLGIARALASEGCHIMLNGFGDHSVISALQTELQHASPIAQLKVSYSAADMSKPEDILAMITQAVDELGGIDIVINNAGIQHVDAIEDFPPEKWDAILAINLSSSFHIIQHVMPLMKKQGWGRIIQMASAHGLVASPKKTAYVSAKHGVLGLTKSVALETAGLGITCNAICPGWVLTPLVEKQIAAISLSQKLSYDEAKRQLLSEKQPSKEFVSIEEIGALAVFLCGDMARSITGAAIAIDGGWTAQ